MQCHLEICFAEREKKLTLDMLEVVRKMIFKICLPKMLHLRIKVFFVKSISRIFLKNIM